MKMALLKYLICPYTREELELKNAQIVNGEIRSGTLIAKKSGRTYPIIEYIPVMLDTATRSAASKYSEWAQQWKDKKFEFNTTDDDAGIPIKLQRERYRFDNINVKKAVVYEAGCGGGRLTPAFYSETTEAYIALDMSSAIWETRAKHKHRKNIHFIQGDIANSPFRDSSIDVIIALGVIQHTKDPQTTCIGLGRVLAVGGTCIASIYMLPRNIFVRSKLAYTNCIRFVFRILHIPSSAVRAWAWLSVLAFNRGHIFRLLGWAFFQQASYNTSDKYTWLINYDFYHPNTYQYSISREKTQRMFLHAGLVPLFEPPGKESENSYVFKRFI